MYSAMLNVRDRKCVVIGGGNIALRKTKKLAAAGAQVTIVSPDFTAGFEAFNTVTKQYSPQDPDGAFLAVAATNNRQVNRQIASDAKSKNILVSLCDSAELSDFITPASCASGDITLSVSTNGQSPLLAKKLCLEKSKDLDLYSSVLPVFEKQRREAPLSGDTKPRRCILSISFGTSYRDTLEKTIGAVEKSLRDEFNTEVIRAFTSGMIIKKLKKRDNVHTHTVETALTELYARGYTDVYCVPTHIINGSEYEKALRAADKFRTVMNIHISRPLISSTEDYFKIADIFSKRLTDKNRLYIFMGHGSDHFANSVYAALDYHFKYAGMDNVYIGTVEGFPDLEAVLRQIKNRDTKNVTLIPFMLVCGDHAGNDMAVDWKNELEENGFNVNCVMEGLGEIKEIRDMYIEHLREIWE